MHITENLHVHDTAIDVIIPEIYISLDSKENYFKTKSSPKDQIIKICR